MSQRRSDAWHLRHGAIKIPRDKPTFIGADFASGPDQSAFGMPYGLPKIVPMTETEAQEYGPQWGSYMTGGDPGAIMYSAIPPEQPEHRDEMVAWLRDHCLPIAKRNAIGFPEPGEPDDRQQIRRMMAYLKGLTY